MAGRPVDLRARLKAVRKELSELLFEQQHLLLVVGPNLEARYQQVIGRYEAELAQLELELRRTRRALELSRARVALGGSVDPLEIESQLDLELADYRRQAEEQRDRLEAAERRLQRLRSPETSAAVRSLYRQLVRRLHPDLFPEQSEQQRQLWFEVQQAYQWGDWQKLEMLLAVCDEEFSETPEELLRLEQRRSRLSQDLLELRQSFPFVHQQALGDENWIQQRSAALKLQIVLARQRLEKLRILLSEYQT